MSLELLPAFPWRPYAGYFKPHQRKLAGLLIAGCVQSVLYIPFAALLRRIFDVALPAANTAVLWKAAAGILALQLAGLALTYWMRVTALAVNQNIAARVRNESLARLYDLPRAFHTAVDLERLHVTLVYDTDRLALMNEALTVRFLPSGLSALALFGVMAWIDPRYAAIVGVAAPVLLVFNRLLTREAWLRRAGVRKAFENFSRGVRFVVTALDLTRGSAAEAWELARQDGNIDALQRAELSQSRFDSMQEVAQGAVLMLATLTVLVAGGHAVADGSVTRGAMMAFYVAAALFANNARAMVGAIPAIRFGMRAFQEISQILCYPEREPYQGTKETGSIEEIRFEGVGFSYGEGQEILNDVSLTISRGARVALIGANGSGKSSLIHLLAGYYRPQTGRVLANGIPYDELSVPSLRERIAIVPQNPVLFSGTVRANIAYGMSVRPDGGDRDLEEALEWAGATAVIRRLPHGLDTEIGDQGVRLSGGERQSLAIARALLRRPDLLVLDEPTNHLDAEAIERLAASLEGLPFRPAVLVISHEAHVLRHATVAYRIASGRLSLAALPALR